MIPPAFLRSLYTFMPDRVTVAYREQTTLGVFATAVSVADSWWRAGGGTAEYQPSFGVATRANRTWYFPKASFTGQPNIGDALTNPVTSIDPVAALWTVLSVNDVGALGAWELGAVSLQLQENLRGVLNFLRPDSATDAAGRPRPVYSTFAAVVPARVQPEGGQAGEVFDRVTMPKRFTAFLGQTLDVRAKDRAYDPATATYYTVVSSAMPQRLDALQECTLESIL